MAAENREESFDPALAETYARLVESIDQGFTVIRMIFDPAGKPVDYEFLETNPAFEHQSGLGDVQGKRMREIEPDHEEYWFQFLGNVARTGKPIRFAMPAQHLDNRWFDVYAFRPRTADQNKVAVLFKDITAEKRAEERLRWSETIHKFLLLLGDRLGSMKTGDDVANTAVETLSHFLKIERCGYFSVEESEPATECAAEWRPGEKPLLRREDLPLLGPDIDRFLRSGEAWIISDLTSASAASAPREAWSDLFPGAAGLLLRPVLRNGKLAGVLYCADSSPREWSHEEQELIREVAERTRDACVHTAAEQAIRDSEARLATIVEHLPVGVAIFDADGEFTVSNAMMRRYAPGGLPSSHPAEVTKWRSVDHDGHVLPPDQWPGARAGRGEEVHQIEFEYRDGDFQDWVLVSAVPLDLTEGSPARVLVMIESIAARKRYEQEIVAASRLKDEFLSLVSHELRTPLTVIRGNAHLLAYRPLSDDSREEVISDLVGATERFTRIVENMLVLGRIAVGQMPAVQPVHFNRVLASEIRRFKKEHERNVLLEGEAASLIVLGVEEYVGQILDNLLSNAHKYSPSGLPVTIAVSCSESRVIVSVQDRGRGVQNPERLFAPFFREETGEGTPAGLGIGLAVCKRLVEAQGGSISVGARPGGGTTFTFSLPLAPDQPQPFDRNSGTP